MTMSENSSCSFTYSSIYFLHAAHVFLSRKVFKKLGFELSDDVIHNITTCKQWAAEQLLLMLREKIDSFPVHQLSPPNSASGERFEHGQLCRFHINLFPSQLSFCFFCKSHSDIKAM